MVLENNQGSPGRATVCASHVSATRLKAASFAECHQWNENEWTGSALGAWERGSTSQTKTRRVTCPGPFASELEPQNGQGLHV